MVDLEERDAEIGAGSPLGDGSNECASLHLAACLIACETARHA
jgi:hypothetical protein